ncbi:DUF551 domain-containing protein [Atlantibacter sp.]|uniref:DUF551 domain-containing protein n=1 Tax=Atlantibacter sp. TaxID=1903473 RepID=UPI0028B2031B|nr:DUF551 domain-containing protein [Atlantibacter sp.]
MTINERVSDERLNTIKSWRETYGQDANVMIPASEAESIISELQQYRAAAEPVAWTDQNGLELLGLGMPVEVASKKCGEFYVALYASPQVTSVPDAFDEIGSWKNHRDTPTAAPAVQAEQLSGNTEQVSQPVLPKHSPCVDAPDHIWLQTAGEWPASGEFSELTWSCDNQHPDDTLYVRADLVGKSPGYLQGYKDGCEWSALMAEANHPQTGDWLFDDPIELAKAIRKGPDMLPVEPGNSPAIPDGWIPVSERMPETMTSVLVTGTWFHHAVSFWDGASWCDLDYEPPVTHWMPLPNPPQQEAE